MNDISQGMEVMASDRMSIIFSYLLVNPSPVEDKVDVLQYVSAQTGGLRGSLLALFIGKIDEFYQTYNEFPSYDYMMQLEGFSFVLSDRSNGLTRVDIKGVVDLEVSYHKRIQYSNDVIQAAQDLASPFDEVVHKIGSLADGLFTGKGVYEVPDDLMDVYVAEEDAPLGALCFVRQLDALMKGIKPGGVMIVAGFVQTFKTTFGVHFAYSNAMLGYNVAFLTLEVPRDYVRFMILSRHSYNSKFSARGDPISHDALRNRELSEEEKDFMREVDDDLNNNPKYGKIFVIELFDFTNLTITGIKGYLTSLPVELDVFVVDYLQRFQYYYDKTMKLDHTTSVIDHYVNMFDVICKNLDGRKIAGLLLSQTSRESYKKAMDNNGEYDLTSLSQARELERVAYSIVFLYVDKELRESGEFKIAMPKNRGGPPLIEPIIVNIDPRFCVLGDSIQSFGSSGNADFSGLLTPGLGFGG